MSECEGKSTTKSGYNFLNVQPLSVLSVLGFMILVYRHTRMKVAMSCCMMSISGLGNTAHR